MENQRPENWWYSTPKIVNGKILCVAILPDGKETTNLFTLEELSSFLTQRAPDVCPADGGKHSWYPNKDNYLIYSCRKCGARG